jgi:hypothetical protein
MLWQWPSDPDFTCILDIALFQEKLYVLATARVGLRPYPLRLYDIHINGDKYSVSIRCLISTPKNELTRRDARGLPHYLVNQPLFEVFQAEGMSSGQGRWNQNRNLNSVRVCAGL